MRHTIQKHIDAIESGRVDKTTVTGLRKALNAFERVARGYSTGRTSARMTATEREAILDSLLPNVRPVVIGELHDSGVTLLRNKRHAKKLESVADIVTDLVEIRLVGFDYIGPYGLHTTPVYRAYNRAGSSFPFSCIPWQAGGHGPEIMSGNYW